MIEGVPTACQPVIVLPGLYFMTDFSQDNEPEFSQLESLVAIEWLPRI